MIALSIGVCWLCSGCLWQCCGDRCVVGVGFDGERVGERGDVVGEVV